MIATFVIAIAIRFWPPPALELSKYVEGESPHYFRALDALKAKTIHSGMSLQELFAVSAPDSMKKVGPYTSCE
ncbi:MAG: hypothetical protein N2C14_31835, partial [Planctomycetales bacterium]